MHQLALEGVWTLFERLSGKRVNVCVLSETLVWQLGLKESCFYTDTDGWIDGDGEVVKQFPSLLSFLSRLIPSLDEKLPRDANTKWHPHSKVRFSQTSPPFGSQISSQFLIYLLLQTSFSFLHSCLIPLPLSSCCLVIPSSVFLSWFLFRCVFCFLLLTSLCCFKLIYGSVTVLLFSGTLKVCFKESKYAMAVQVFLFMSVCVYKEKDIKTVWQTQRRTCCYLQWDLVCSETV